MSTWPSRHCVVTSESKVSLGLIAEILAWNNITDLAISTRSDRRPPDTHDILRRRDYRAQTPLQNNTRIVGLHGKGRPSTLGAIPCLAAAGQICQITLVHAQELPATGAHFHALERVLPGA